MIHFCFVFKEQLATHNVSLEGCEGEGCCAQVSASVDHGTAPQEHFNHIWLTGDSSNVNWLKPWLVPDRYVGTHIQQKLNGCNVACRTRKVQGRDADSVLCM